MLTFVDASGAPYYYYYYSNICHTYEYIRTGSTINIVNCLQISCFIVK